MYFVEALKICNVSFSVCCTFTCSSSTFDVCSWDDILQMSCFQKQWAHPLVQQQPMRKGKFVKVKQAQVRIILPLLFPSGNDSKRSELPNGRQGDFPPSWLLFYPSPSSPWLQTATDNRAVPAQHNRQWQETIVESFWGRRQIFDRLSKSSRVDLSAGTSEKVQQCSPVSTTINESETKCDERIYIYNDIQQALWQPVSQTSWCHRLQFTLNLDATKGDSRHSGFRLRGWDDFWKFSHVTL